MGLSKRTVLLYAAIVTFGVGALYFGLTMKSPRPSNDPYSWDILIFTQTWPNTLCYTWIGENPNHTCNFPSQKNLWTVHGIWPTKLGTTGPEFCNKSLPFDTKAIFGIQPDLNYYWTDLEVPPNNTTTDVISSNTTTHKKESIWFHEWEKHGTCAIALPALNSEYKYFYQGIDWSKKYNMKDILEKSGIQVNSTLNVTDYWKAVKTVLKTNTWIECSFKHDTKEQMLAEIRICFDKTLNLIDCDGIMKSQLKSKKIHSLTNCDMKKKILYLDYVPKHNTSINSNSTNSNTTVDEHSMVLFRSKRNVVNHLNWWRNMTPRPLNRSKSHNAHVYSNNKDWDLLIFSQSWPYTFCHTWTTNSNTHTCNLPANRNQWTIHGIWPSKTGSFGPFFCHNQTSFSLDSLNTIIPELHNRWTEIKNSKSWSRKQEGEFWKYEWIKHGSCAKSLTTLDSEFKYFKQGIDWSKEYQLHDILAQGGIKPDSSYPVTQFWHTLKTALGKNPRIDCFTQNNSNKVYINEIRLCFDKTLTLVDCDPFRKNKDKPYTDCPLDKDIYYIGAVF